MAVSNMNLIRALVSQLRDAACGGGGDGLRTKTIISSEFRGYNTHNRDFELKLYTNEIVRFVHHRS